MGVWAQNREKVTKQGSNIFFLLIWQNLVVGRHRAPSTSSVTEPETNSSQMS
jgi:hypothetical protein